MPKHHLLISGTGRAGTTFLTQLLTELGLDTGFANAQSGLHQASNAGMELDIQKPDAPYIIKAPQLCETLEEILQTSDIIIDHAIIPMRHLSAAAESRRTVHRRAGKAPGGLVGFKREKIGWFRRRKNPAAQESVLAQLQYHLVFTLVKHDVPTTWLHFPRFAKDPAYLFEKLQSILKSPRLAPDLNYEQFLKAFRAVSRPELIHDFEKQQAQVNTSRPKLFRRAFDLLQGRASVEKSIPCEPWKNKRQPE